MNPTVKTSLMVNAKMFRGQASKMSEAIFKNPYRDGLLHYLRWESGQESEIGESPGALIDDEFRNRQQPVIDDLLKLVLQEIQHQSKEIESASFLKCLAKVRRESPSSFQNVANWITQIFRDVAPGTICEEVIGLILVHRLCSTIKWERAFMLNGIAKAHLDLGALFGEPISKQNYLKVGKVTLGALGAMYAVPLPNKQLLTMPVFADTAQVGAAQLSVAGMYPNLFWPLRLPKSHGSQTPQIVRDRLTAAAESLRPGKTPTRLAKMLTDPAFLSLTTKPAPGDRDLRVVTLVGEQMLNDLHRVLVMDFKVKDVRSVLESRYQYQLSEEIFQDIENNRRPLLQSLSTFCIEGWKKEWIKNNIPLYLNGRERNIPIFKLFLYHSPLIPAMFSRDEWDRYMTSQEGNSLIVNKDWNLYSSFPGEDGSIHISKGLVETHFRPDDYLIRDEINGDSFLEKNLKESVESMSPDTFLSVQKRCKDPLLVIRMLSQDGGQACITLGHTYDLKENKSYLRKALEELQKNPPDISKVRESSGFIWGSPNPCWGNFSQGIRDVLFGEEKTDLVVCNNNFDFMTTPVMYFENAPGEGLSGVSIFDIFLAQLPDFVDQIESRRSYSESRARILKPLMMSDRYWDIPIRPFLHGDSRIRKVAQEKENQKNLYRVFDRLLEILVDASMKIRITVKSGGAPHELTPGGKFLRSLEGPFFDTVVAKGEEYLNSMVEKFYATPTRKEALDLIFPSLPLRKSVHDGVASANYHPLDLMDSEMDYSY